MWWFVTREGVEGVGQVLKETVPWDKGLRPDPEPRREARVSTGMRGTSNIHTQSPVLENFSGCFQPGLSGWSHSFPLFAVGRELNRSQGDQMGGGCNSPGHRRREERRRSEKFCPPPPAWAPRQGGGEGLSLPFIPPIAHVPLTAGAPLSREDSCVWLYFLCRVTSTHSPAPGAAPGSRINSSVCWEFPKVLLRAIFTSRHDFSI